MGESRWGPAFSRHESSHVHRYEPDGLLRVSLRNYNEGTNATSRRPTRPRASLAPLESLSGKGRSERLFFRLLLTLFRVAAVGLGYE